MNETDPAHKITDRPQGTCARKTKHGDGGLVASSDSLDPADTHHARSRQRQIKSKLVHIKTRIEHLEKVPLPAVEHFAEIMNRGEKRSAKRDYMLFGAGVAVSTVISIGLKVFGLG